MRETTAQVRDGKLFYRSEGHGEPVILLHSIGLSSEAWLQLIAPLARKFAVFAVDLMGHGDSDKPDLNYEIHDYARSIVEFADALGIDNARIVGNSLGAMIGLEMSVSFPARVAKQVLVGIPAFSSPWKRMESTMRFALRYDADGRTKPLSMEELSTFYVRPSAELVDWHNNLRAKTGLWCKRAQIAIALWDAIPKLPEVSCPTLVLFGSKDHLRSEMTTLTRGIKGATSALVPNAGHFPQLDDPEGVLKPILAFL